jgi:hypothetical protein
MATPMSAAESVAAYRDDLAGAPQGLHDGELLYRLDPGKDACARHPPVERIRVVPGLGQLRAGRHLGHVPGDIELTGDGQRRMRMIAGDHDDGDSGGAAPRHGLGHLRAHRVDQAYQAEQFQVAQGLRRGGERSVHGHGAARDRDHPVAIRRQPIGLGERGGPVQARAHGQQDFGGALDVGDGPRLASAVIADEAGAIAPMRLVGDETQLRRRGVQRPRVETELRGQDQESDVHGIAQMLHLAAGEADARLVAQRAGLRETQESGPLLDRRFASRYHDRALRPITFPADLRQ